MIVMGVKMEMLTRETWHGHTIGTDNRVNDTVCEDISGGENHNKDC